MADLSLDYQSAEQIRRTTRANVHQTIVHLARLEALARAESSSRINPEWARQVATEVARSRLRASGTGLCRVK